MKYIQTLNDFTTLEFNNDKFETFILNIYNVLGNRVRKVDNILTDKVFLKSNLNSGIYYIELRSSTQTLKGKVLIE